MNRLSPEIIGWAQAAEAKYGVPAALNIAAAIEESGLGAATPPGSNNFHGVKAAGGIQSDTREQTKGGVFYTIRAGFHVFKTPADSFMYYAWLISNGAPYAKAWAKWLASRKTNADVETLTRDIAPEYATALSYAKALVSIEVSDRLFAYDKPASAWPAASPAPAAERIVVAPPVILSPGLRGALAAPVSDYAPPPILSPASTPAPLSPEARLAALQAKLAQVKPAEIPETFWARFEAWWKENIG